jgi:hypothetical protein
MVDTVRTLSALQTLLADNTTADISPQDLRDFLVSAEPHYGSMYFSTPAATTPGGTGTPLKALGTTTSVSLRNFTMPASNRLTYGGAEPRHCSINASVSFITGGTNQLIALHLYHWDDSASSGAVLAHSEVNRLVGTGSDEGATGLAGDVTLDTNDYIELWVENETSTNDITINHGYIHALAVLT